jgi:LAO/AO transport system kinase
MWQKLVNEIKAGSIKALARTISLVENRVEGFEQMLEQIPSSLTPVIGITGPPGAGKSTLTDALLGEMITAGKKVGVICVDPSSPFNLGALLGDRIRMSEWYNNPNVYIRSLATRGSLGGLHPMIIEISEVLKLGGFDYIIVETVGVGQSEIEIAGLADTTIVVVVPEAGDEVQTMKAGLMEIADIFVVNKADRPDAEVFVRNLRTLVAPSIHEKNIEIPIVKTVATVKAGVPELLQKIKWHQQQLTNNTKQNWLLAEKAYHLIQQKRMLNVDKKQLKDEIEYQLKKTETFNLYRFVRERI